MTEVVPEDELKSVSNGLCRVLVVLKIVHDPLHLLPGSGSFLLSTGYMECSHRSPEEAI